MSHYVLKLVSLISSSHKYFTKIVWALWDPGCGHTENRIYVESSEPFNYATDRGTQTVSVVANCVQVYEVPG